MACSMETDEGMDISVCVLHHVISCEHQVISGHLGWVRCVTVDPSNSWFATGSSDRTIKVITLLLM